MKAVWTGREGGNWGQIAFDLFLFRKLTETISSFVPVPPNTHQKKYFL